MLCLPVADLMRRDARAYESSEADEELNNLADQAELQQIGHLIVSTKLR